MSVASPKDKTYASACINWLLRLVKTNVSDLYIRANWPGRTPPTMVSVEILRGDSNSIIPNGSKSLPTSLEVVRVIDLAARFHQKRKFVEIIEKEILRFYEEVGQYLKNWIAPAPKVKTSIAPDTDNEPTMDESKPLSVEG